MHSATDTATHPLFEELDHRGGDGIAVSLLWNRADNSVSVVVFDTKLDHSLAIPVANERALDAFRHPYAYAALHGLETTANGADRDLHPH